MKIRLTTLRPRSGGATRCVVSLVPEGLQPGQRAIMLEMPAERSLPDAAMQAQMAFALSDGVPVTLGSIGFDHAVKIFRSICTLHGHLPPSEAA